MEIRNATIDDLPQIVAIYNATIESGIVTADTSPVSVDSRMPWFEQHSSNKRPIWVGTVSDQEDIVGWLSFNNFYGRPAYDITAEISLYIDEKYRRHGYATMLLQAAIEEAPNLGLKQLLGFIFHSNLQSINLFTKHGFEKWGELKNVAEINKKSQHLLILGLSIR